MRGMDLVLRDVVEDDLPILFEHQIDPVAYAMAAFTPRDREAFMEHWGKILANTTVLKKAIVVDGRVAGHVCCFDRDGKREVGYWIARDHWGRGIATEAVLRFLADVPERPLYAGASAGNAGSIRVLEKCGFVRESEDDDHLILVLR